MTYRIHLKVDKFPTGESNNHLPLVNSTLDNILLTRCLPLIYSFVSSDVTNPIWINLDKHGTKITKKPNNI